MKKNRMIAELLAAALIMAPLLSQQAAAQIAGTAQETESAAQETESAVQETESAAQETESTAQETENAAQADALSLGSPSACLMEASTGTILFEKDAHAKRSPASVTKVMTVLLIFEALESGQLSAEEEVTTSAHAKSMGGSQVFLEEGEKQTVDTLLKCILVSSGNDASVAMAEHIAGTEEQFVKLMNAKAEELGMSDTHFVDCCGLTDSDSHYTSAHDIAVMSRELITRFPEVFGYTRIWMDTITHVTRQGSSEFGLSNTNKLLRSYEGCTGLKTGSTSKALFCVSATAEKNGVELIAAVMAGPDSRTRFADAAALLDYGFGRCSIYTDDLPPRLPRITVKGGIKDDAALILAREFRYLDTSGKSGGKIGRSLELEPQARAPVKKGETAGKLTYYLDGEEIGSVEIVFAEDVERAGYGHYLKKAWEAWCA